MEEIFRIVYDNHIDNSYVRTAHYIAAGDEGMFIEHSITGDILEQEPYDPQPMVNVVTETKMFTDRPALLHKMEEDLFNTLYMYSKQLRSLEIYPKERDMWIYPTKLPGCAICLLAQTYATSKVCLGLDITASASLVKESELLQRLVDTLTNNPKFDIPIKDGVYGLKIEWQGQVVVLPSSAEDLEHVEDGECEEDWETETIE